MKKVNSFFTLVFLHLKCFFVNKIAVATLVIVSVAFLVLSASLVKEYEKKAGLPIGVIDEDQTEFSKEVIRNLRENQGITVQESSKEVIEESLKEGKIYAYFIITKGYEQKVKAGETRKIIKMQYLKDYSFVSVLSDIFAKNTMEQLLLYRADALNEETIDKYHLVERIKYIPYFEEGKFTNANGFFEYDYQNVKNGAAAQSVETKNSIVTTELYLGVITMFSTFLSMFFVLCQRRKREVTKRLQITLIPFFIVELADIAAIFLFKIIADGILAVYISKLLHISRCLKILSVFGNLILFGGLASVCFWILSKWIKSEAVYQFTGILLIFLFGGISIMTAIGQITVPFIDEFAKNIPNYWFITNIIDIILAG